MPDILPGGGSIHRRRDGDKPIKGGTLLSHQAVRTLLKHGASVAGDHHFTLAFDAITVVVDAPFLDLHARGSNTVHTGAVCFRSSSLGIGDGDVSLKIRPACVLTHLGTSLIVFTRSRPGVLRGINNLAEKEKGLALNLPGSRLLTPFLVAREPPVKTISPESQLSPASSQDLHSKLKAEPNTCQDIMCVYTRVLTFGLIIC
ncbi:hypothetical protein ACFLVC_02085 [Chloroflexota bacterium]